MSDRAQRPTDALLHEVARVRRAVFDQRQQLSERPITGLLVVQRQTGQQRERRALDEFFFRPAPFLDLLPRMRSLVEQLEAERVANAPVVEVATPSIHL